MNWYRFIKVAQIWKIESDGSFVGELRRFYKLEYLRSMLKALPFNGFEQRRQNIIKQLEETLWQTIHFLRRSLLNVLQFWINTHAMNPHWLEDDQVFKNVEDIYYRMKPTPSDLNNAIIDISVALNIQHQNGPMLEELADIKEIPYETLQSVMSELSNRTNVEEWNQELREIGVQI